MIDNPLTEARKWLLDWAAIGGGVTITTTGSVVPWRFIADAEGLDNHTQRMHDAERAEALLGQLVAHPELCGPMRVISSTNARQMAYRARRALGDII